MLGVVVFIIVVILVGSGAIGSGPFLVGLLIGTGLIILGAIKIMNTECTQEKNDEYMRKKFQEEYEKQQQWNLYRGCERYTPPKEEDDK